ncbi:MAG: right-handed parallel beta-helix repeat-containing protein [Pyrinomonadaceae bacterium]
MNELPRQKLRELVARHGRGLAEDARRCEGLLRDYCGGYRREVSALVSALEEHAAKELLDAPAGTPREVLLARLARRLCDHLALSEHAAVWAVDSWALALGVVSDDEHQAIERRRAQQTETTTAANEATAIPLPPPIAAHVAAAATTTEPTNKPPPVPSAAAARSLIISIKGGGDYASIGDALKNVPAGARLLIRPGLYQEGFVIDREVELVGDGPAEDVIIRSTDASCILMRAERATVSGLTLRGCAAGGGNAGFFAVDVQRGKLMLDDCDITSDTLSCVAVHGPETDPTIRRCRIHDGADSGVYFFDGAAGKVEACEVYGNANVGIAITSRANPSVRHSKVYDGKNAGVVVWQEGLGLIEECAIYGNRLAGVGSSEGGHPTLRACRIFDGDNSGVFVHRGGECTVEGCDISGHREAEVAVTTRGNLSLRGGKIHHGRNAGVFVREDGRALLQECSIKDNAESGVVVGAGALAAVRRCHVNGNGQVAIRVAEGGAASVEDTDLSGNLLGPWDVADGAFVESERNRER